MNASIARSWSRGGDQATAPQVAAQDVSCHSNMLKSGFSPISTPAPAAAMMIDATLRLITAKSEQRSELVQTGVVMPRVLGH